MKNVENTFFVKKTKKVDPFEGKIKKYAYVFLLLSPLQNDTIVMS